MEIGKIYNRFFFFCLVSGNNCYKIHYTELYNWYEISVVTVLVVYNCILHYSVRHDENIIVWYLLAHC